MAAFTTQRGRSRNKSLIIPIIFGFSILAVFFTVYALSIMANDYNTDVSAIDITPPSSRNNQNQIPKTTTTSTTTAADDSNNNNSYTSCLEETLQNLPIGKGAGRLRRNLMVWAHHYDARNSQWNQDIRFDPLPELSSEHCSVWEVGAHTRAEDSATFLQQYPHCQYHAYEPIPNYYKQLVRHWKVKHTTDNADNMHLHNYGLGGNHFQFPVSSDMLKNQATYIGDAAASAAAADNDESSPSQQQQQQSQQKDGDTTATIQTFAYAVNDAGGNKPTVLHMNCEGCEWDLLQQAMDTNFLQDIPVIQIGFHNYGSVGLGARAIEYCQLRLQLSKTHTLVPGAVPFAWERWVLVKRK
mmetsp:Transcript_26873/g.40823  ORF Transcript_26873/g.40823 Transcript_26873/m.40823 type:complete len:355 (+) Transcript_26873:148-1212(+)